MITRTFWKTIQIQLIWRLKPFKTMSNGCNSISRKLGNGFRYSIDGGILCKQYFYFITIQIRFF